MRILVVGMLKNDDDGTMREMTDAFEGKYRRDIATGQVTEVTRVDNVNGLGAVQGQFDVVVLCGHSQCYKDVKCIEVQYRGVGGFDLGATTTWLLTLVAS